ncbi:MAG: prolipoprotein diacylglyceryl transferase [Victivallales bacterium]|nr:prolipoprotein diacylglyceryl transferase [Victivallales bacterium]
MLNPEIISIGPLSLRWYGLMAACGLLSAFLLAGKRAKRYGFTQQTVSDIVFWGMLAGLIGARALYVIRFWSEEFADRPADIFKIYQGGLVFYGGFAGATIIVLLMCWKNHWAPWRAADLLAPALALGHAFGRIGCLLNGCCYGFVYQGPLAISYSHCPGSRFPVQGLFSFCDLCICGALLWLERHGKCRRHLFLVYLCLYSVARFCAEYARGDYPAEQLWHGLTPAQITCLWALPVSLLVYYAAPRLASRFAKGRNG